MTEDFAERLVIQGLTLTPAELALLEPLFVRYLAELERLRSLDLRQPEPPLAFAPRANDGDADG